MIERPREEVFQYFLNLDQHVAQTNPDVESSRRIGTTPGVGTAFRFTWQALDHSGDDNALHLDCSQ